MCLTCVQNQSLWRNLCMEAFSRTEGPENERLARAAYAYVLFCEFRCDSLRDVFVRGRSLVLATSCCFKARLRVGTRVCACDAAVCAQAARQLRRCRCNWRRMFLERPCVRSDGVYVSRNTYFRLGTVHWDVKNPVHLVVYYRYFRFFADGTVLTRTSPEPVSKVWNSLFRMPEALTASDNRLQGRWQLRVGF